MERRGIYSQLVYDEQQKDLILSFVQHHNFDKHTSDPATSAAASVSSNHTLAPVKDANISKCQGLVVLLSGPPGTGKTLMAKAVADRTRRPLVYLQAEDLGTHADELGPRLRRCLTMPTEWNATVLLDEADVFMAERDPSNILRNELVSIFLRELASFRGILFLRTNLSRSIEPAFRRRVSLHLLFGPLTREAREHLWRNFLGGLAPSVSGADH